MNLSTKLWLKTENFTISQLSWPLRKKGKITLLTATLTVGENKVPYLLFQDKKVKIWPSHLFVCVFWFSMPGNKQTWLSLDNKLRALFIL